MTSDTLWNPAMPSLTRTVSLVRHNVALLAREPGPIIARIAQPVALILILRPLYVSAMGDEGMGTIQMAVGFLALFSLLGMSIVGGAILTERVWNTLDRLRTTPAGAGELIIGKAVPVLLFLMLQQAVVLGLAVTVLDLEVANYGLLALAITAWAMTVLCIGSMIAVLVRSFAELSTAIDIGGFALAVLGGALVPLSIMPGWAQSIAPLSPAYWAISGLRSALTGATSDTLLACGMLAIFALSCGTVAAIRLARGWGRSTLL